ncbi:MAG: PAS domain S-box protein [Chloroflexi bacterium]|nr:PAS domain S-box protein [Chloroflexota bacterium]
MKDNGARQTRVNELHQRIEKAISLPAEDFHKIPPADIRAFMCDLDREMHELETRVEQLNQTRIELGESRKQITELFDFAPVGYFILDSQSNILNVNITASDMLGISTAKLVNTPFLNLIEPQYYSAFRAYIKEIADTGHRLSTEIEMRGCDSTAFHAQLQTIALYEKSNITYRVSVADITGRKRVEKALKESEQKYRDLADLLPEIIFETDTRGTVTYANRKAFLSFGLTPDELAKGINIFEYITAEDRSIAREKFTMVLQRGDIGANEYTLLRKDGTTFPALAHTVRVLREGETIGMRGIVVDLTESKRAERTLRESEKRLRTTLDSMLEGCVIIDFNWRYLYVNDAAAKFGHRTKEERLGRTMMEVFPGIEQQETFTHLRMCLEGRIPDRYETEFTFPEGNKAWFEVRVEPVPEGILILYWDITERKL